MNFQSDTANDTLRQTQGDSLRQVKVDNTQSSSTISQQDSAEIYEPSDIHGSINKIIGIGFRKINKTDLAYKEYHGFSEMLEEFVPALPYNLGSPGLFNSFSFFGANPNNVAFSFNGRPLFDAEYNSLNPEQLCTEFFESIEVMTGSDAVILSDNSSGALLNIQEIKYNTKTPFTKLWYSQGGNGYLSADGIFSQNFAPNLNFTFGFRRQTGQGRYINSWVDSWNVRSLLRWTPDEKTSISFVEYFTNHGIGMNGGIDKSQSFKSGSQELFDENYAIPFYIDFSQRVFRHDLTLSGTRQLDDDSTSFISGNVYISNSNWENGLIPILKKDIIDTLGNEKSMSKYYGANVSLEHELFKSFTLKAGADAYMIDMERSFYHDTLETKSLAAYALGKINFFELFSISGGVRIRNYNNKTIISEGIKLNFIYDEINSLMLDLSISERMPSPVEGFYLENEKNTLLLFEYGFNNENTKIKLGASYRIISDPIVYENNFGLYFINNQDTRNIWGTYILLNQKLFNNIVIDAQVLLNNTIEDINYKYPPIFAKLSMYYEIQSGRSILRLGASGKYASSFYGETFLPQNRGYMTYDTESEMMFDGLKVFASAKLGNAYVKASLENILGVGYYSVPVYPYYGRNFRLSFSWSFLD